MGNNDLRWKQRFQNYEMAFFKLKEAMEQENLNELERDGLIQRFEFTIDLSWKVMKDYLEEKGFVFKPSPKDTLREAQRAGLIDFGQVLIDGLDIRNELSHDYSGSKFEVSEEALRDEVYPALQMLYQFFVDEGGQEQLADLNE
ncbi:MAG: nucleotidyltransferase substrate binding protein [Prolixibacteraceae bacterium]|jgi:nucleotidyltransferase substrate binding protein (TIGR01987 family)|nr:nucleotidyltransferase substrate binding protein [Prolixibacteraceae bacterium]